MITRTLPYGDTTIQVSLPDRTRFPSRDLRSGLQPVADQAEAVLTALAKPLGLPRIRELVRPGGRVLIAFDDPTVPSFGPVPLGHREHPRRAGGGRCPGGERQPSLRQRPPP